MSKKLKGLLLALVLCLQVVVPATKADAATVLYNNATGYEGNYAYELWKDYGDTSMTLKGNGLFECWWENIGNVLFRKGVKWDCTQTYSQLGNITVTYGVDYQPNGNSYLCVYGWCRNPLVEYYIVDCWGTWRPPGATSKGTITVDGAVYDVYETTRVNQPSIDGNTTFQQYWSVRQSKRTSGTISVTEHFKAWERLGMKMGLMYEAAFNVEGYQSSGWADVYQLDITVGGSGGSSSGGSSSNDGASSAPGTNQGTVIECESMEKSGQYTGNVTSPFDGVALYGNDDAVSTTVNFSSGTHDFSLRGASDGDNLAQVDLYIGGQNKGTFYFGDANVAEYTIKNVSTGTGNQKVELRMTADEGSWDLYADALIIGGDGVSVNGGSSSGGNQGGNTSGGTTNTGATMECEDMTKSGQYTGNVSSPFNGVALYANDDAVSYTQNFTSSTNTFTLTGASNGDNMARVDLFIDGQNKGTFYYGDANVADFVIENVSTGTGNKKVELKVTADDGSWDAYIDKLTINGGAASGGNTGDNSGSQGGNQGGNTGDNSGNQGGNTSGGNTSGGTTNTGATMECEDMTKSGQYTGNVSSPFNGVALYANDDAVSYTQNFTSSTNTFTLTGASNGDNMARVDLFIDGQNKGTFYYGDANVADFVIENVSTGTGNKKVELKVTADDGSWDAYIDKLTINGGAASGGNTGDNSGSQGGNQGGNTSGGNQGGNTGDNSGNQGGNTSGGTTNTGATMECEDMTKSGQYTGNVSSPFDGVALYANDDAVSYTQYFAEGTHDFTLRGASNGDNMARVDLFIGGENKGTFYYGDANIAEYTISNVSHGTGNQKVELKVTADDGTWDAYIDSLTISPAGSVETDNGSNSGNGGSSINPNGKMVALTFDDGPTSTTSQVLDVLDKYGVKATFFLVGQNINGNTRSILERQNAAGHELANHSYTHSDMTTMSYSAIQNEINQTNNLIKQYTGQTAKFFRPPYISVNNTMYSAIDMGFVQGTMHNDWDGTSSSYQIANSVTSGVKDGQIILLHDFQGNTATVNALPTIIETLQSQGYQFVTMSQLFEYKGKNANVDYKIWSSVYD